MSKKLSLIFLAILALTLVVATNGCATANPVGLTEEQVASMTKNILQAINANDYSGFVQYFSASAKTTYTQDMFTSLRHLLQTASGNYISIGAPSLSTDQGYAVYRFPCKFEEETVYVTITFLVGGQKVEGLFFDSANLRLNV